jgi:hypothetical protein
VRWCIPFSVVRIKKCFVRVAGRIMAKKSISLLVFFKCTASRERSMIAGAALAIRVKIQFASSASRSICALFSSLQTISLPDRLSLQLCYSSVVTDSRTLPEDVTLSFAFQRHRQNSYPSFSTNSTSRSRHQEGGGARGRASTKSGIARRHSRRCGHRENSAEYSTGCTIACDS